MQCRVVSDFTLDYPEFVRINSNKICEHAEHNIRPTDEGKPGTAFCRSPTFDDRYYYVDVLAGHCGCLAKATFNTCCHLDAVARKSGLDHLVPTATFTRSEEEDEVCTVTEKNEPSSQIDSDMDSGSLALEIFDKMDHKEGITQEMVEINGIVRKLRGFCTGVNAEATANRILDVLRELHEELKPQPFTFIPSKDRASFIRKRNQTAICPLLPGRQKGRYNEGKRQEKSTSMCIYVCNDDLCLLILTCK